MNLTEIKGRLSCAVRTQVMLRSFERNQSEGGKTAILISTPSHGNLGDQAIVYAQRRFLGDALPDFRLFEIQRYQYERAKEKIGKMVGPEDVIIVDGGGNVGTLWPEENDKINDIVVRFKNNHVLVFPQTAHFEEGEAGKACERETAAAYKTNAGLVFFSRDRKTLDTITELSPGTPNHYAPDIVLYIDDALAARDRAGALLCLRDDKEKAVDSGLDGAVESALREMGLAVGRTSTVVAEPMRIFQGNRDVVLRLKWSEFASSELVVTDRLHGMFFSAITGTPCVALDNVSRKVSQGYEWVREIPNIKLAASADEVAGLAREVMGVGPLRYDRALLEPQFEQMRAVVRSALV